MKRYLYTIFAIAFFASCQKEKQEMAVENESVDVEKPTSLAFEQKTYAKESRICKKECTYVDIKVPEATGGDPAIADSINKALFKVSRSIVYFGEEPTNAKDYDELTSMFIQSYDNLVKKYPEEAAWAWEAKIDATKEYQSENIINFKVNNFMFTGGAHGYEGNRSVIIDAKTGATLKLDDIIKDKAAFTAYAETAFRKKFNIPAKQPINSKGLMFEKNIFTLPANIFYGEDGITLLYNPVEITSFADGAKTLFIPYSEADKFLKVK
ncbi:MAG: PdaC/SigV domain-containing protein [Flavobacterium sp.]